MIYAEIWASEDEGAAEAVRLSLLLTVPQHESFKLLAKGNGTKKQAIEQAQSYVREGPYKAVRVLQGKREKRCIYQGHADTNLNPPEGL